MSAPGARGALADAVDALAARPEEEQLALVPSRFDEKSGAHKRAIDQVARHRRGRPPGAQNLATRQMLDYVRRVLGDPLLERARMAMHTPASLAAELGCKPIEAAELLDKIRADLMRLFYAPLAPVDGDGNVVAPQFNMVVGGNAGVAVNADLPPWLGAWSGFAPPGVEPQKTQQNQGVLSSPDAVSHGDVSHGDGK